MILVGPDDALFPGATQPRAKWLAWLDFSSMIASRVPPNMCSFPCLDLPPVIASVGLCPTKIMASLSRLPRSVDQVAEIVRVSNVHSFTTLIYDVRASEQ